MHDRKSEPHEFVGEHREDAVAKACAFFGVDQQALSIAEFDPAEVSGLGGRSVIVAELRERQAPRRESPRREERPSGRPPERRSERHADDGPRGERPRRGAGRGGDARPDGNRAGPERSRERPERSRERPERSRERPERSREEPERERAKPEPPSAPSVGTARGELGELGGFVLGVVERMDLGPFEIRENQEGDLLAFEVTGEAAQALATGGGRCVDALQLLANQAAVPLGVEARRVVVDVEGDAEAREEFLGRLAQRVARRARESGRSVALDPMNARDRRLIHIALRDEDDVATLSSGEGRYRQVIVAPEGTAEFDDARRESEEREPQED